LQRQTTLERAFELAENGEMSTVNEIRARLKKEQMDSVDAHLAGQTIQKQLRERLARAKLTIKVPQA
jgi:hypothetical protein